MITNAWIKNEKYRESIIDVIGKAIGDCVEKEGVFKGKQAGELIKFENTVPKEYEQENWNAVTLYNYVFRCLYGEEDIKVDYRQKILDGIERDLFKEYSNILESSHQVRKENGAESVTVKYMIEKATNDISAYAEAFNMEDILEQIQLASERYQKAPKPCNMAPQIVSLSFNDDQNETKIQFSNDNHLIYRTNNWIFQLRDEKSIWNYSPTFRWQNNKWKIVQMDIDVGELGSNKDQYSKTDTYPYDDLNQIKKVCAYVLDLLDGLVSN